MEWEITIHKEDKYVEVVTKGYADSHGSVEMAKAIASTMRMNKLTSALIDHRNISGVSGSVVDIVQRPAVFRIIGMLLGIRIAAIINPEYTDHFKFLEIVCLNQGYSYSAFYHRTDAMAWLLK